MAGLASYDADLLAALEALSPNTEAKFDFEMRDILDLPSCTPEALKKLSGHPDARSHSARTPRPARPRLEEPGLRHVPSARPRGPAKRARRSRSTRRSRPRPPTSGGLPDLRHGLGLRSRSRPPGPSGRPAHAGRGHRPPRSTRGRGLADPARGGGARGRASDRSAAATSVCEIYATRARLVAHVDRWDEADAEIALAIERERSGERHYVLRIGKNDQNLRVDALRQARRVKLFAAARRARTASSPPCRSRFASYRTARPVPGAAASCWPRVAFVADGIQVADAMSLRDGVALMAAIAAASSRRSPGSTSCSSPSARPSGRRSCSSSGSPSSPASGAPTVPGDGSRSMGRHPLVDDRGHGVDEDRIGAVQRLAWVLDGASPLGDSASPASVQTPRGSPTSWTAPCAALRRDRRPRWST